MDAAFPARRAEDRGGGGGGAGRLGISGGRGDLAAGARLRTPPRRPAARRCHRSRRSGVLGLPDRLADGQQARRADFAITRSRTSCLPLLPLRRQPTLLLVGDDDPLDPLVNAKIMHWLISGSELHVYRGGHLELIAEPHRLAPVVERFLAVGAGND